MHMCACVRACVSLRRIAEFSYIFLLYVFPFINMDTFEKEPSALSIYRTCSICVQLRKCGANKSDFSLSMPENVYVRAKHMRAYHCMSVCMRELICKQNCELGGLKVQGRKRYLMDRHKNQIKNQIMSDMHSTA